MTCMLLRWLGTVAAARTYLSSKQADLIVTMDMSTHVVISSFCHLLIAYVRAPSKISTFNEFKHFFFGKSLKSKSGI
ncbi:hypothetical protein TIFTF001_002443 [Ficus carica]|uniref:Uncharacterized protein n=1 Tax=Ficus carica TaxID=3494 RepID=A0AA87ZU68_FICCA|nr:hypothetical protein TIFTF001_002443 [Ficus carica]